MHIKKIQYFLIVNYILWLGISCSPKVSTNSGDDLSSLVERLDQTEGLEQAKIYALLEEKINEPDLIPILGELINDSTKKETSRFMGISLLSKMAVNKNERAVLELLKALQNEEEVTGRIRHILARELIKIRDPIVPGLVDLLIISKNKESLQNSVIYILSQIKSDLVITLLIEEMVKNKDEKIRSEISFTLTLIGPKAIDRLKPLLNSEDESLRKIASSTIRTIKVWYYSSGIREDSRLRDGGKL
jgi:hypothetical protein